jgi:hypothetical protein
MENIESGLLLCKSFSPNPFWVLFANVNEAKFLLDENNRIKRDKRNYGFLLIPTMTIGNKNTFGGFTHSDFIQRCWDMGLREHPNYFFGVIYSLIVDNWTNDIKNKLATEFKELYNENELLIRFYEVFNKLTRTSAYGYYYNNKTNYIDCNNQENLKLYSLVQILNVLITALSLKNEDDYHNTISKSYKAYTTFYNK